MQKDLSNETFWDVASKSLFRKVNERIADLLLQEFNALNIPLTRSKIDRKPKVFRIYRK